MASPPTAPVSVATTHHLGALLAIWGQPRLSQYVGLTEAFVWGKPSSPAVLPIVPGRRDSCLLAEPWAVVTLCTVTELGYLCCYVICTPRTQEMPGGRRLCAVHRSSSGLSTLQDTRALWYQPVPLPLAFSVTLASLERVCAGGNSKFL